MGAIGAAKAGAPSLEVDGKCVALTPEGIRGIKGNKDEVGAKLVAAICKSIES